MDFLKLTHEKLNVSAISDLVGDDLCGAISLFVGTTRDNFEGKKVLTLEYEAYETMAVKQMKKICDDLRIAWPDLVKIAIYHRLGLVPVREASVVIAISSPHRKSSLAAVNLAIEELKKSVPIWKKEKYDGDESAWKENKECFHSSKSLKRSKLDFSMCSVEKQNIPSNLVQIAANESEIKRRIHCFVEKKREEIDLNNILDFTEIKRTADEIKSGVCEEEESTCARTNSVVIKQEDSNCHLRVRRVKNRIGPQIKPDYLLTLDKLMTSSHGCTSDTKPLPMGIKIKEEPRETTDELPLGLRERMQNIEKHLNLRTINTKHIYERIKAMENKILYLESISPEYKHFWVGSEKPMGFQEETSSVTPNSVLSIPIKKKTYTADEIDAFIDQISQNDSSDKDEEKPIVLKSEPIR